MPRTPGPVAGTDLLGGNIGITLMLGIPVALIAWLSIFTCAFVQWFIV